MSMTYYLKSGNRFNVTTRDSLDLHETLPAATYTVQFDQQRGAFFLETIEDFEIKGRIYGDTDRNCRRIFSTFLDRKNSTGVMLTGNKGSGKTLLAKMLSVHARSEGMPTIVINQPWCGESFNKFIQMIEQPTVILFDEFEKVYDNDDQEKMLTLLDGVYPSKKLFILTCNDKWRVNEHMRNRPGRIYYMLDYRGLSNEFIIEYCQDNLENKSHIENVCRIASVFGQFNFDMLKAMVEEMNRYNESPQQVIAMLNARPEFSEASDYQVELSPANKKLQTAEKTWKGNPLMQTISVDFTYHDPNDDDDSNWDCSRFTHSDIKEISSGSGKFVFVNQDGDRLTLTRIHERHYEYRDF